MSKVLALNISISEDGYIAGPNQSFEEPLGKNGMLLHEWVFSTRAFKEWIGESGGALGLDNEYVARGFHNIGASIMGRNMFAPSRGTWPDDGWKEWWGLSPNFRHQVFILTHYPREPVDMGNGTVFHFVTGGIVRALALSKEAAGEKDIRVGGGANTLQQSLEAGLLDEIHLAQVPVQLGSGELLFTNPGVQLRHYRALTPVDSQSVRHLTYLKI